MKKQAAIDFLTAQGHLSTIEQVSDDIACISFKYRGKSIGLYSTESDPAFLYLRCGFPLDKAERDELSVLLAIKKIDENYKVAKTGFDAGEQSVYATAQQFLPECPEFAAIFWRTTGLVASAASEAWEAVNPLVLPGHSAERFTEAFEAELHG
jgi:hypothetical protein